MDDNKFWLSLWMTILICLVVTATSAMYLSFWHEQKMAGLGYQETMIQGSSMPHWQKVPAVGVRIGKPEDIQRKGKCK